ncbi:ABC transporter substrate-binding protein [Propionibacterium freudenreichii]|uniref:ABC transporter substrate-binding protein n=1 Tax=Propionibacterium freudenreichii TaxID=1744 RepID=UPI00254C1DBE|nr:ABC transporter substrate-binding protein [Propionibacterium freudenreichii]MDK9659409.1 ABC transporter substrate-binding protein [Propionibacterium freudenreichii]
MSAYSRPNSPRPNSVRSSSGRSSSARPNVARRLPARSRLVALGLGLAIAATGCAGAPGSGSSSASATGGAFPVSVNNCGRTVTVKQQPTRAVALNQGAIEETLALGVQKQMAGTAYLDDKVADKYKDAYASIPVLADKYPTKEVFAQAKPDFALASYASAFSDKAVGTRDELEQQGIPTYLDPFACDNKADRAQVSFDNVWSSLGDIAKLFGQPGNATTVIDAQKTELDAVKQAKAGDGQKVFWWDSQTDTPFTGGNAGGPALVMQSVGATNAFADVDGAWANVPWEKVVAADPDVIVLADASWSTSQSKIDYISNDPALKNLKAVQNKRFITVPFSQTTPGATLVDGAKSVSDQLAALPR